MLYGSKPKDLPSNKLPCPVFPPIPQMDPSSRTLLGFSPTPCFATTAGCAWAIDGTCAVYVIARRLQNGLPSGSKTESDGSKTGETPASPTDSVAGNA